MKNKLLAIILTVLFYLSFTTLVFAQGLIDCSKVEVPFQTLCKSTSTNAPGIIGAAISFIFVIAVIIAIFFLLWGAVRWILSGGDKVAIEGARNQIIASIVGLIILFLGFLIFNVVLTFFDIKFTDLKVPTIK